MTSWNTGLTRESDARVAQYASVQQEGQCDLCGLTGRKGPIKYHERSCTPTLERFREVLIQRGYIGIDDPAACWVLPGRQIRPKINRIRVHAVAFRVVHGIVPVGKVICHTCDVPGCGNPAHLWAGTQAENIADMRAKGRGYAPPQKRVYREATCPTCEQITQRHDRQKDYCSHKCYLTRNTRLK